jgi:C_GCAxxG_C_C family probable redox protein
MTGAETALEYFARHYNCAQSTLVGCGEISGLTPEAALRVAGGFGGGMRVGTVCGAATGGVMALSCALPFTDAEHLEDKERLGDVVARFMAEFVTEHGSFDCNTLVRGDKEAAHTAICPGLIAWAVAEAGRLAAEQRDAL